MDSSSSPDSERRIRAGRKRGSPVIIRIAWCCNFSMSCAWSTVQLCLYLRDSRIPSLLDTLFIIESIWSIWSCSTVVENYSEVFVGLDSIYRNIIPDRGRTNEILGKSDSYAFSFGRIKINEPFRGPPSEFFKIFV